MSIGGTDGAFSGYGSRMIDDRAERRNLAAAGTLLAALSVLSAVLLSVTDSPPKAAPLFFSTPGHIVSLQPHGVVGQTMYFGMTDLRHESGAPLRIHVLSAVPIVKVNTSHAVVSAVLCTINPAAGVGGVGSEFQSLIVKTCSRLQPAAGSDFTVRPIGKQQIALRIDPRRVGVAIVSGIDLTYRLGPNPPQRDGRLRSQDRHTLLARPTGGDWDRPCSAQT